MFNTVALAGLDLWHIILRKKFIIKEKRSINTTVSAKTWLHHIIYQNQTWRQHNNPGQSVSSSVTITELSNCLSNMTLELRICHLVNIPICTYIITVDQISSH